MSFAGGDYSDWDNDWEFINGRWEYVGEWKTEPPKSPTTSVVKQNPLDKYPNYGSKISNPDSVEGLTLTEIELATLKINVVTEIQKTLDDNIVYVNPDVIVKFYQMMAIGGKKEIYGKLVTHEEGGYIVVSDCLIPYQTVNGAHFKSYDEQMSKWLYETMFIDNDPKKDEEGKAQGEMLPMDEIEKMRKSIKGHFHSHNSINRSSKPSPSGVDTTDVMEHRIDRPYWVEIIGSFAGFSARIATQEPKTLTKAEVRMKWWDGIMNTLQECEGKLFLKEGYKSTYTTKVVKEDAAKHGGGKTTEKKEAGAEGKKVVTEDGSNEEKKQSEVTTLSTFMPPNIDYKGSYCIEGDNFIAIQWSENDPIQISKAYMPEPFQEAIALSFKSLLKDGEILMVEVYKDSKALDWAIYDDEKIWVTDILTRFKVEQPAAYGQYEKVMLEYGLSEDASFFYRPEGDKGEEIVCDAPRTLSYQKGITLLYDQFSEESRAEMEAYETEEAIDAAIKQLENVEV